MEIILDCYQDQDIKVIYFSNSLVYIANSHIELTKYLNDHKQRKIKISSIYIKFNMYYLLHLDRLLLYDFINKINVLSGYLELIDFGLKLSNIETTIELSEFGLENNFIDYQDNFYFTQIFHPYNKVMWSNILNLNKKVILPIPYCKTSKSII